MLLQHTLLYEMYFKLFREGLPLKLHIIYIRCPTTYQTGQFFNNSKTNVDIATRFEQGRNEEECVCSARLVVQYPH
jgi:hypothetical protein